MEVSEYYADLYRRGTGWLGWSSEEVLTTPIPLLIEAIRGRTEMINEVVGTLFDGVATMLGGKPSKRPEAKVDKQKKVASVSARLRHFAAMHNASLKAKHKE